jgi:hypothetical protein
MEQKTGVRLLGIKRVNMSVIHSEFDSVFLFTFTNPDSIAQPHLALGMESKEHKMHCNRELGSGLRGGRDINKIDTSCSKFAFVSVTEHSTGSHPFSVTFVRVGHCCQ